MTDPVAIFNTRFAQALDRRSALIQSSHTDAMRLFSGSADGFDGVFVDRYADGAVLIEYEGQTPKNFDPISAAAGVLNLLRPSGLKAVYHKPFARDRSRMGGQLPACVTEPSPLVGAPLPESILIREYDCKLEVRLYDGLSTGLFLDQRENRKWVSQWVRDRSKSTGSQVQVLNTFAYTCAFSVASARAGAITASVDVSGRYLDWGKRNFVHNGIDPAPHRFAKMDTFEFLRYASRKGMRFDLIVLDPPSFASGNKKKGIRPWSAVEDYPRLVTEALGVLSARGVVLASTNTQELCRSDRLRKQVGQAIGRTPRWVQLPDMPTDFSRDQDRFASIAFSV